jgi:thymidylate synthase (FAD)
MKIVKPSFEILTPMDKESIYKQIELVARTCYKSEDHITDASAPKMVKALINRKHLAMIEHAHVSVKFVCDRGVSHEIVRHRLASYAQESTRYCDYSLGKHGNEITVIEPFFFKPFTPEYAAWKTACETSEKMYLDLLSMGCSPQEARSVLPNSLKTEIVVTMNLREWIHFFNLRVLGTTGAPHPQMKEAAFPVLEAFARELPEVFGELYGDAIFKED